MVYTGWAIYLKTLKYLENYASDIKKVGNESCSSRRGTSNDTTLDPPPPPPGGGSGGSSLVSLDVPLRDEQLSLPTFFYPMHSSRDISMSSDKWPTLYSAHKGITIDECVFLLFGS